MVEIEPKIGIGLLKVDYFPRLFIRSSFAPFSFRPNI